jgi:hypothetical protein
MSGIVGGGKPASWREMLCLSVNVVVAFDVAIVDGFP